MDSDKDKILCESFPLLYRDRNGDPSKTNMVWGFPETGWFQLLYDLSEQLERLIEEMPKQQKDKCKAIQVKEKFGFLRFYIVGATLQMMNLIIEAENKSGDICEFCGSPGKLRDDRNWFKTMCDTCDAIEYIIK